MKGILSRFKQRRQATAPEFDVRKEMNLELKIDNPTSNEELNTLFKNAWPNHEKEDFQPLLKKTWFYACAYDKTELVGFAKVIWDGGTHSFLLDSTVSAEFQRKGIGMKLVELCTQESRKRGAEWLHVDFEPHLKAFYESCGFRSTDAGLINLMSDESEQNAAQRCVYK